MEAHHPSILHDSATLLATGRFGGIILISPDEQGGDVEMLQLVANVVARVQTTNGDELFKQGEPAFLSTRQDGYGQ